MASTSLLSRRCASTPAVNASTVSGNRSLGRSGSPAAMCTTRKPGSTSTMSGWSPSHRRVKTVECTPAWASDDTSSRTYTFMPPLSPTPGWTSGDVWKERTASRRTTGQTLPSGSGFPLVDLTCAARPLLGHERLVDPHQCLFLLLGELSVVEDRH